MNDPDWMKPITEREQAATEGPWVFSGDLCNGNHLEREGRPRPPIIEATGGMQWQCGREDGEFMAHARTDLPLVRDMLRLVGEALKSAERGGSEWGAPPRCPCCDAMMDEPDNHEADCVLAIALAAYRSGVLPKGEPDDA